MPNENVCDKPTSSGLTDKRPDQREAAVIDGVVRLEYNEHG